MQQTKDLGTSPIGSSASVPTTAGAHSLHDVFTLMNQLGGGFASALAAAWFRADSLNRLRIETTWADYVEDYREMLSAPTPPPEPTPR